MVVIKFTFVNMVRSLSFDKRKVKQNTTKETTPKISGMLLVLENEIPQTITPNKDENKKTILSSFTRVLSILLTFHFVAFCWIFFRAKDFATALQVIENIGKITVDFNQWLVVAQGYKNVFALMAIGYFWHYIPERVMHAVQNVFVSLPLLTKAIVLGFIFWLVYATAAAGPQPFIYFQF